MWRSRGLHHNPFAYLSQAQEVRLALVDLALVDQFLAQTEGPWAIQWLGPHGWGKTTQMRAMWAHFFPEAPFLHLKQHRPREVPRQAPVAFLDGVEGCGWWERRRLWSRSQTNWVVSTHRDFSQELRHAGRVVWERTPGVVELDWLDQVVRRRVALASVEGKEDTLQVSREALSHLIAVHRGNLRAMVKVLYFLAQQLEGGKRIEVKDVVEFGES